MVAVGKNKETILYRFFFFSFANFFLRYICIIYNIERDMTLYSLISI